MTGHGSLPPPLNLRRPPAARHRSGLLLAAAVRRFEFVEQPEEEPAATENGIAHLPEVPRRALAGLRARDRAAGIPDFPGWNQTQQTRPRCEAARQAWRARRAAVARVARQRERPVERALRVHRSGPDVSERAKPVGARCTMPNCLPQSARPRSRKGSHDRPNEVLRWGCRGGRMGIPNPSRGFPRRLVCPSGG